jgi:hypothetical protein
VTGFSTWWRSAAAGKGGTVAGKPRRFFYAAGEPALVAEVESYVRHRFFISSARTSTTIRDTLALESSDLQDFAKLRQHLEIPALDAPYRLVVIRSPHKLTTSTWHELTAWARSPSTPHSIYLLLLGDQLDQFHDRHDQDPRHQLFVANPAGLYVNCKPLDEARQITYVRNKAPLLPMHLATPLVHMCGGDLVRLKSEVEKLQACADVNGFISDQLFARIIVPSPGDQFIEALTHEDKPTALARAPFVRSTHAILTRLERRITELFLIRTAMRVKGDRAYDKKISEYTALPIFTIHRLRPHARTFDTGTVRTRYNAVIEAYRALTKIGDDPSRILVPLVARW